MKRQFELKQTPWHIATLKALFYFSLDSGYSIAYICTMLLVAKSTLYKWSQERKEKGTAALETKKRGRKVGSGRILSPKEETKIQELITSTLPTDFGLNFSYWDRRAISELILLKFKKIVAVRTISDYTKRWNFTPQVPIKQAYQRDPIKVKEWLTTTFINIKEKAQKLGARIFFAEPRSSHRIY
jgi:transposase